MKRIGYSVCITWYMFLLISFVSSCSVPERLHRRMETVTPGNQNEIGVAVNEDDRMKDALAIILDEFKSIGAARPRKQCMTGMNDTLKRVGQVVQNLGFPSFDGCMSRIEFEHQKDEGVKSKKLSMALDAFENGLASKATNAISLINPSIIDDQKGFGKPVEVGDIPWKKPDGYYECTIHHSNAYRVREQWNYIAELTNEPSNKDVGYRKRYFYREMFSLNGSDVTVQPVTIPRCTNGGEKYFSGNAWVEVWGGETNASVYMEGDIDSNPALLSALGTISGKEEDVVMDSDIASNLAILILPTFLALVPLSLFQDVGTGVTVIYVLFTDVISVLPIGIKGVELLHLANREHYAKSGYVYGSAQSPILAVEMWVSSCHLKPFVRIRGIVLLVIAGVATIAGIILEFAVKAKVEKYKRLNNAHLSKELEMDERLSLDTSPTLQGRRSSIYSERVVNYIQKGGSGGLLWHMSQQREFRN